MSCASCALNVEKALEKAEGVKMARVNFASEKAYLEYDPEMVDEEKLAEVVRATGYDVKDEKERVTLDIGGMTCAGCAATVEKALKGTEGVYEANVNIATEKGTVEYDPSILTKNDLKKVVANSGYEVIGFEGDNREVEQDDDLRKVEEARWKMWGTWAFTIPIIAWMIPEMFFWNYLARSDDF